MIYKRNQGIPQERGLITNITYTSENKIAQKLQMATANHYKNISLFFGVKKRSKSQINIIKNDHIRTLYHTTLQLVYNSVRNALIS